MISGLTNEKLVSVEETAILDFNKFRRALKVVAADICRFKNMKSVCLLGVARGGLPFMTGVSHFSGIRNVTSLQAQMNKSDNRDDYGDAFLINENFDTSYENYILFEDIIYKGKSINEVVKTLKRYGKNILAIYSIVIDDNYAKDSVFEYEDIPIKYVYSICKDDWVYFPWEKGYPDEKIK